MADFFLDKTTAVLAKSLDYTGIRHRVIANNIANVETPGFTRSDISFREALNEALNSSNPRNVLDRIKRLEPEIEVDHLSPARPNGNNVAIEKEMAEMTKNSLEYETYIRLLGMKGSMIQSAIREGR